MALIMALLIGMAWLVVIGKEKIQTKKVRELSCDIQNKDSIRMSEWLSKVTNKELEDSLDTALLLSDESLLKEVRDSWVYYFGIKAPEYYQREITKHGVHRFAFSGNHVIDRTTALRILMANRGMLTVEDATHGIRFCASSSDPITEKWEHRVSMRFLHAINDRLKEHGINEEMYENRYNPALGHDEPLEFYYCGVAKWYPMMSLRVFSNNAS